MRKIVSTRRSCPSNCRKQPGVQFQPHQDKLSTVLLDFADPFLPENDPEAYEEALTIAINKLNGIHFTSSEEIHTLCHLYESMLKEMRDAAVDSGEFYTPRAVVRFMVEVSHPKLGETVLDPACGTGGFLVEGFAHLEKQCKIVQDRQTLQTKSIFGCEAG